MSQAIRKYEGGGKSPQEPELFEWKDVNKYNKSDVVAGLYRNIDTYIQHNGLSGDKANQFRKSANQFIEGIKNGTVTMNGDGTFTDASGTMSSTGKYDKKFLGMGTKNTENNAFNRVGDFASSYIKSLSPYKAQEAAKPATNAKPIDFRQRLANIAMGGTWNSDVWRKFNSQDRFNFIKQAAQASHNDFLNNPEAEFNKDVFGTRDNWIERSSGLLKALEDGKYDPEDLKYSAAMGYGDLNDYLTDPGSGDINLMDAYREALVNQAKSQGILGEDAINAFVEKGMREQAKREQDVIKTNQEELKRQSTQEYFDKYKKENPFKSTMSGYFGNITPKYNRKGVLDYVRNLPNPTTYFQNALGRTAFRPDNGQHIVNNMDIALAANRAQFPDAGDGFVAVPTTYDFNNYTAIVYNPDTKQYKEVSMLDIPALQQLAYAHYENPESTKEPQVVPKANRPKGTYFQQGGTLDFTAGIERLYQEEMAKQQQQVEDTALSTGRSVEQVKQDNTPHTSFSAADKVRMGALAGDVASLIASLTGVGSVASAGLGAASTAANQAADMMEGQSFGQALWNNAGSYALDVISLIPFAKAAKVPKMIKAIGRFAPLMTTALATYQGLANLDDYKNTWGKVGRGESLNVSDWRNILNSLQLVAGGTAATHRASKAKSNVNAAKSADTVWMKTPQGWRKVDAGIANKVQAATSIDAQNKLLKDTGIQLEEARSWGGLGKGKGVAEVKTTPFYDFNKTVTTYSGDLPLEHTFGPGERWLGTAQLPSIRIPGLRDAYNKVVHPKAYKKAKGGGKKADASKPAELLALPAPNQVTPGTRGSFGPSATTGRRTTDVTNPEKLAQTRATGDRNRRNEAVVAERLNRQAQARESKNAKNEALVAWATNQPHSKQPLAGAARANKEKTYRDVFQPVVEREYNAVWDEAIKGKKDFGYEDVTPRRSIYAPPVTTEITVAAPTQMTDKNARYLWELVNTPKRSTAHVKREPPKKQTKPKAKKTSKDDRVTKKAIGGTLVPKYQGGKQIRNVASAADLNWNTDILGSTGYNSTLGMINPANASTYNNMQGAYSKLGFTNVKPGATKLAYNKDVADYQTNFNANTNVNSDTMAGLVKAGRITGRGGSSDKGTQWAADGYAGDQTWLRHLGTTAITPENLAKVRAGVGNNIDVVKNLDQGMLNFMPALKRAGITSGEPQAAMPTKLTSPVNNATTPVSNAPSPASATNSTPTSDGTITPGASPNKKGLGFNVLPEDVIALGRMVGGLHANNKAAEQYKAGLKPLLIDTYENTVPIQGNLFAKMSADKQASDLTSLAARPRTSDASLQLAGQLEAQNRAGQMRFQGDMADADMFYKTRMLAQQESDAAKARRTEVANRNRASMLQIDAAKAQIDAAKTTANYQQVINPYLSGIENQFRQNRAAKKQYEAESYRQGLLANMQPQWDAATKAGDTAAQQRLMREYNTNMLNYSKDNVGMPWMFQKKTTVPGSPQWVKQGGKLTSQERIIIQRAKDFNRRMLQDNKQFHKDIVAAKKQHADLIKHMSSLTAELIKKGMSWK